MFAPECVRKSALPDLLEIALLPCLVILAPAAAATKDEAVEQLKVCKPVPPVPQVSICEPSPMSNFKDFSFMTIAAAVTSVSDTPFSFNPIRKDSISSSSDIPDIIKLMASCISLRVRSSLLFILLIKSFIFS